MIEHIAAVTWKITGQNCDACGIQLHPGQTAFLLSDGHLAHYCTCYTCGEAIKCHLGWTDVADSPDTLPTAAQPAPWPTGRGARPAAQPAARPTDVEPWWPLPQPPSQVTDQ